MQRAQINSADSTEFSLKKTKGKGHGNFKEDKQPINETTESFRNFIRRYRNSPATKRTYTDWFRRSVEYSNLPEIRAKIGVNVGDNTDLLLFDDTRKIQNHIKYFIDYEYEVKHLTPKTVQGHYNAVKHFYESNEVTLNWNIMKDYVGSTSNVSANLDMPYTYEEIHKMLDKCDERKRVIVYLLCSSGMRRGAIPELKVGDLKYIEEYGIYETTVYKGFKEEYITYYSSECANAIRSYLDFRKRKGEQISPDSYLVRKQFDTRTGVGIVKLSDANDPPEKTKMTVKQVEAALYQLIYDSGIRLDADKKTRHGDRHRNMAAHAFRKFFENKCLEGGIDPFYVSVLMGHKAGIGVEKHYYRPGSIEGKYSLLQLYAEKAMPLLTISSEERARQQMKESMEEKMKQETERWTKAFEDFKREEGAKFKQTVDELYKRLGLPPSPT
jgi:integrase